VLQILNEQARKGSVTAAAALERALQARANAEEDDLDQELDRILTKRSPSISSATTAD
jgi:hypothetical protein